MKQSPHKHVWRQDYSDEEGDRKRQRECWWRADEGATTSTMKWTQQVRQKSLHLMLKLSRELGESIHFDLQTTFTYWHIHKVYKKEERERGWTEGKGKDHETYTSILSHAWCALETKERSLHDDAKGSVEGWVKWKAWKSPKERERGKITREEAVEEEGKSCWYDMTYDDGGERSQYYSWNIIKRWRWKWNPLSTFSPPSFRFSTWFFLFSVAICVSTSSTHNSLFSRYQLYGMNTFWLLHFTPWSQLNQFIPSDVE